LHNLLLLDATEEAGLLVIGLEATVTDLGGSVDELEGDLLEGSTGGLREKRLTERDDTLLRAANTTLDHQPVLVDLTIADEATERGDSLLGRIVVALGVLLVVTLTDAVDLLVDLGTVVVTVLTGTGDLELNASRMPGTDTGDLAQTTVSLTGQAGDTPTGDDTVDTATLSNTDAVDHLVLLENRVDLHLLLEKTNAEVDLSGHVTTVDLDLLDVGLLLTDLHLGDLSVGDHADDVAVLLGTLDLLLHVAVLGVLLGVLGESFLLALVPVLVEATLDLLTQVLGEHGGEGAEATRSLDVTDKSDAHHRRGLQDGNALNDLLLVELGTRLVNLAHDVGHTGLVPHESRQMARLRGIVLREGFDLTPVVSGALLREKSQRTVARALELTMRHLPS